MSACTWTKVKASSYRCDGATTHPRARASHVCATAPAAAPAAAAAAEPAPAPGATPEASGAANGATAPGHPHRGPGIEYAGKKRRGRPPKGTPEPPPFDPPADARVLPMVTPEAYTAAPPREPAERPLAALPARAEPIVRSAKRRPILSDLEGKVQHQLNPTNFYAIGRVLVRGRTHYAFLVFDATSVVQAIKQMARTADAIAGVTRTSIAVELRLEAGPDPASREFPGAAP